MSDSRALVSQPSERTITAAPISEIVTGITAARGLADVGPAYTLSTLGALLILTAGGAVVLDPPASSLLATPLGYIATIVTGAAMLLLAGGLRIAWEITATRSSVKIAEAHYTAIERVRAATVAAAVQSGDTATEASRRPRELLLTMARERVAWADDDIGHTRTPPYSAMSIPGRLAPDSQPGRPVHSRSRPL